MAQTQLKAVSETLNSHLLERLGMFAYKCLKTEGYIEIAQKLASSEDLSRAEIERLANEARLPILAKLVELVSSIKPAKEVKLRPLLSLSLEDIAQESSFEDKLQCFSDTIDKIDQNLSYSGPIFIRLDSWITEGSLSEKLSLLKQAVVSKTERVNKFKVLSPSSADIKKLLAKGDIEDISEVFSALLENGIDTIEGGCGLDVHFKAAEKGMKLVIGQEVQSIADSGANHQAYFSDAFIDLLISIKELSESGLVEHWFPFTSKNSDTSIHDNQPLGAQMLRAVALGRLVLRDVDYIRAPLTMLGVKLSTAAQSFGANDLGFAAVDSRTSEKLGLIKMSDIQGLVESDFSYRHVTV